MSVIKSERPTGKLVPLHVCTALVISSMIGVGVFTSLGYQVASIRSPFIILLLWFTGGLVALCGAFSYTVLCSAYPRSGGEYNFLSQLYHPSLGFMGGVMSAVVGFAAPIAISAMAFSTYLRAILLHFDPDANATWTPYALIAIVASLQLRSLRLSSTVQNILTICNVTLIAVFILAGLTYATWQPISFGVSLSDLNIVFSKPFAISLMYVMYAYSGWNAAAYILDEVTDVRKAAGWGILSGTVITGVLYVLLNCVFMLVTPFESLSGKTEVGEIAAQHVFGPKGALLVASMICIALAGSVSSLLWTGARVISSMGQDIRLLKFLAHTNKGGVPNIAVFSLAAVAYVYLATSTFNSAVVFVGFVLTLCSALCVFGAMRIKWRSAPTLASKLLGILGPLVFLSVTISALVMIQLKESIGSGGLQSISLALLLPVITVLAYFPLQRWSERAKN